MANKKSTKRALMLSALSLLLCVSMFVGTTFAWFTDSVSTVNNKIVAGNLDVELEYSVDGKTWNPVNGTTNVFKEDTLWEPGHTEVVYLRVTNLGSLALKYQLGVNIVNEIEGVNVNDKPLKLSDYIMFDAVESPDLTTYADRDAAVNAVASTAKKISAGYAKSSSLTSGADEYVALVVYMPTTVGNEANYKTGTTRPEIDLGINLYATQYTYESDSFDEFYDGGATWLGGVEIDWYLENPGATEFVIGSAEDLAGLAAIVNGTATAPVSTFAANVPATIHNDFKGKTIKLGSDIDLNGSAWTPIGRIGASSTDFTYAFKGTFDGQNHTVANLSVSNSGWAGLFGIAHGATINNVVINGVGIQSNRMTGAVVGQLYGSIDNCHVKNATIMVTPNAVGNSYDNGDKVGGIVGWLGDNGNNRTLTNCSAENVDLGAYRDVGGIAGYVASSTIVDKNSAKSVDITVDQITFNYGAKDFNAGLIYGRTGGTIVEGANTADENSSIDISYERNGITLKKNGVTGEVRLYLVPSDYDGTTVEVPEGVDTIGGYAFAYNSNIKEIVLPSTVTTLNDRAFRDTSASKVVLNEGLTNISYQAFRNALNVTEVVIPSTVKTISKEAFQNSGITNLTIPANVTTIEYGGCRDMKNLTTVTIEGNVDIPVYAFRACTNLKTVIITGDNVTFGGGSKGMIFTNKENGDGTAITVYVANEEVKARLIAADTAAKDYGGYNIVIIGDTVAEGETIVDSLTDGADTIYVPAGTYTFPSSGISAGDTIICAEGTVFSGVSGLSINGATVIGATFDATGNTNDGTGAGTGTINGTFKNCTFTGNHALRYCYPGETVVFEDCVFDADKRGIHFDAGANDIIFENCILNGFHAVGGEITKITFKGCTFDASNHSYNGLNLYCNAELINCVYNFRSGKTNFIDMEGTGKTLTITNCTATLDGEDVNIADYVGGSKLAQNTVIIDGVTQKKASTQEDLNSALTGDVDVTLSNGNYNLPGVSNGDVTINGTKDTVITITKPAYHGSDVTLNGVTIQASGSHTGIQHVNTVTYNDVTINGEMNLYGEKVVFNGCTFNLAKGQYIWTYGAEEVEFNNCTFNTAGKAILIYKDGGLINTTVTVKGCTFNASAGDKAGAIKNQNCAAIEIHNYQSNITLVTENNTVDSDFSGEWRIKQYDTTNNCTITVNGTAYTDEALDGTILNVVNSEVQ